MDCYKFGYPEQCNKCGALSNVELKLPMPYYNNVTSSKKIMLIGQDPYIYRNHNRVEYVLMLNEEKGQLKRWLGGLFGNDIFSEVELYATNVVKCPVKREPSSSLKRVLSLLRPYFENCRDYLITEINQFKPTLVLTFGEPAHKLFIGILSNGDAFEDRTKEAFTGEFKQAVLGDIRFDYSPCLHIKTYRVAETYGDRIRKFKNHLMEKLNSGSSSSS